MRVFIALDIADSIRQSITEYVNRVRGLAPDARWARPESLHVTLKFIGEASDARVQEIKNALSTVQAAPFAIKFQDVGFFPNPKSPRVFWVGMSAGEALPQLAATVDAALVKVGVPGEEKAYRPHLTVARTGSGPGAKHQLQPLANAEAPPQFGTMMAREFWLYRSEPQRGGSRYTKLERFGLE
ncbi:MAG TPA: RNA 2',3'-cyclic phosphodiesterase [Candidatus Angelobacter sp.]|nr:RNA 2',3'-cyclic phosphodiesterase [Candidatus Angelobacter sp.]